MPTVALIEGIKVNIYGLDHPPPHVHFLCADFMLKMEIASGRIVSSTAEVGSKREKMMRAWVHEHRKELHKRWVLGSRGELIPKM